MNTKRSIKSDNERRTYQILNAIRDYEKSLSAEEQEKMQETHQKGVEYLFSMIDDAQINIPKALALSAYMIREADRRHAFDGMEEQLLEITHGEDPLACITRAGMIAARMNVAVTDRIKMAVCAAKELFDTDSLNDPVESLTD